MTQKQAIDITGGREQLNNFASDGHPALNHERLIMKTCMLRLLLVFLMTGVLAYSAAWRKR